ncbi:ATP-binding cassette sub-family A member 6 [Frankliniella fusca]|uniref:ATP-binding cassette sub-family A member 6 n=1 Tax=Frankliniella fusca TaxID=407009 RepID=A0AAE1LNM4_9NEOP|nr:ATP-binding cassette sub-family A member 6 [Frankliniella fusca]
MDAIKSNQERNLTVAFKATGICPLNRNQALKRIPGGLKSPSRQEVYEQVFRTFLQRLEEQRYGEKGAPRRGRRLQVSPGKSRAAPNPDTQPEPSDEDEEEVDRSGSDAETELNGTPRRRRRQAPAPNKRPRARPKQGGGRPVTAATEPNQARVEPQQGDYVLVKRAGKTSVKYSVGQVSHIDEHLELAWNALLPQFPPWESLKGTPS